MENAPNLDRVHSGAEEEEPIVADAKPEFFSSPECPYVGFARLSETMQRSENAHSGGLVQLPDIGFGGFGPDNALHFVSLKRSISS
jgi:hypothetical protein